MDILCHSIKTAELFQSLSEIGSVKIIMTNSAAKFVSKADLVSTVPAAGSETTIYCDEDEHTIYRKRGDPVLHIQVLLSLFHPWV